MSNAARKLKKLPFSLYITAVLLFCAFFCAAFIPSAWADDKTETLSGSYASSYTVDASVNHVILGGATFSSDAELIIAGDATVEIKEGTQNSIAAFGCEGNTTFTGSGTLNTKALVFSGPYGTFNHTGIINVEQGTITSTAGNLIFNSGTLNFTKSEDLAYSILSLS